MYQRNKVEIKAYFEEIDQHLIRELNNAKESILICVAWISWKLYTPILNRLSRKGVKIEIIYYNDFRNRKYLKIPDEEVPQRSPSQQIQKKENSKKVSKVQQQSYKTL